MVVPDRPGTDQKDVLPWGPGYRSTRGRDPAALTRFMAGVPGPQHPNSSCRGYNAPMAPSVVWSLLADQFVADARGKFTIVGVWDEISAVNYPAVHPLLFIVTAWRGMPNGSFLAETRIWTPAQSLLFSTGPHPVVPGPSGKSIAIDQAVLLQFPTPGVYRLELVADRQSVHTSDFSLLQPNPPGSRVNV